MRTASGLHSWISEKIEMSAPSSATEAATYGSSSSRPITGMLTMQNVVTTPLSDTSTSSGSTGAKLSGELMTGGTNTRPVVVQREPRILLSFSARR